MTILILKLTLPLILVVGAFVMRAYLKIARPALRTLGSILPKLCVVNSDEIQRYSGLSQEGAAPPPNHLQRETRWAQVRVNWGYLCEMAWNTTLFQQAMRFEKMKIDPTKSALAYEPQERLAWELADETTEMRWRLFRWQAALLWRAFWGLTINHRVLIDLLAQYKQLEQEMVALTEMAEDDCYRQLLIERLGLSHWGLLDGGAPASA